MQLINFSAAGWESWDVSRQPLIRDRMPVLVDDDLRFEDSPGAPRPALVANRWLRELPMNGAPAVRTWQNNAGCLRDWLRFLKDRGVDPLGDRHDLQAVLSMYAEYRFAGELENRWDMTTWNLHVGILSSFYRWARDEGWAVAVPFSYRAGKRMADGVLVEAERNLAKMRTPRPHTSIKYLERDFSELFVRVLAGLDPNGEPDRQYRGREGARNSSMAGLVLSSGLRGQEFTYLTVHEVPPLPARPSPVPVLFPLAHAVTKGQKPRTSWISYEALADVHQYIELDRAASAEGFAWRPPSKLGKPLVVEEPDWEGAYLNGQRRSWRQLSPSERLRLVAVNGESPLVGLQSSGKPFIDYATVFRRTSARIRDRFDPRFPTVARHRLRHSMAMQTLEWLITGYYRRAAELVKGTGDDAAMALYLTKSDPMLVLRDLLGHQSVVSTEIYIARLDVTRLYGDAYRQVTEESDPATVAAADAEFKGEDLD
ncbi:site-specific integrase [Streptomyces benahoarensis]|uniref:Site-specific integrase n=1 Tax=Streptomyces benahoarensis TaxID=2595054 RepID=A0A553ZNU4_9ACTN|nr:site-specific integrase [Streptomyces benahoarensis]TSB26604.1 site-specific integrase [Streptomyces benahoarensis]TSB43129.1 site-specific integrase [Streptomyces benahoarensis]